MRNPNNRPIDDLVFSCCRDLFAAYQLDLQPGASDDFPSTKELAVCGVMGFGGKLMRGALVLAATSEPLERTNPEGFGSPRDWICELANQLMGRVKNQLLPLGVEVLLATPAGLSGENLSPSPGKLRVPQVFAAANGFVVVWIECEFAEGFELHLTPSEHFEAALPEGETLLF
jgi:hypothetical protein